jgi:hypothetical protein
VFHNRLSNGDPLFVPIVAHVVPSAEYSNVVDARPDA